VIGIVGGVVADGIVEIHPRIVRSGSGVSVPGARVVATGATARVIISRARAIIDPIPVFIVIRFRDERQQDWLLGKADHKNKEERNTSPPLRPKPSQP
jgi:hypothetical protein